MTLKVRDSTMLAVATIVAATAAMVLPYAGRSGAVLSLVLIAGTVALLHKLEHPSRSAIRIVYASAIGLLPTVMVIGALHDLLTVEIPVEVTRVLLLVAWWAASSAFGAPLAERLAGRTALIDAGARALGVVAVAVGMASALTRHLVTERGTAARLAWMMSEEDNAHIVGVAREVLTHGPSGSVLAEQFGTAFVNLPLMFLRLAGGPLQGEDDVRLQAISLVVLSTIVIMLIAGATMALLAGLPHHVHEAPRRAKPRDSGRSVAAGAIASMIGAGVVYALLVVLPMRTGFLTLVWGLTLVASAAAVVAVTPHDASTRARLVVCLHLAGTLVLLLGSWPFIAVAAAPVLLVPLTWVPWHRVRSMARQHVRRTVAVVGVAAVAGAGLVAWAVTTGPLAEVLSYGRGILLVQASGIEADRSSTIVVAATMLTATALVALRLRGPARTLLVLAALGPPLAAGLFYVSLRVAAELLTDGELNYSGVKLLYAVITLAALIGIPLLTSLASRFGPMALVAVIAALSVGYLSSPTLQLLTDWRDRTDPQWAPHAEATVQAIRSSSADLPIRCLPPPGVAVTDRTRWAAFFCIRWMEDAFNEDRFNGHRRAFLNAEGPTFEATVEQALDATPERYFFAYPFTMGPGWFGWNGTD
jgi:hypothetical protein